MDCIFFFIISPMVYLKIPLVLTVVLYFVYFTLILNITFFDKSCLHLTGYLLRIEITLHIFKTRINLFCFILTASISMLQNWIGKWITTYLIFTCLLMLAYYQVCLTHPFIGLKFQLLIILSNFNHLEWNFILRLF